MTLDAIDRAFIARWQSRGPAAPPGQSPEPEPAPTPVAAPAEPEPTPRQRSPIAPPPCHSLGAPDLANPDLANPDLANPDLANPELVVRLLVAGAPQWAVLADEVEAARLAGHRTIGIAGGERSEGRTTLVTCLARTLRDRNRDVVVLAGERAAIGSRGVPADGGRLHDKRIVLVDAGIWFPSGPIRRPRLMMASLGCDAAILVRRADRAAAPAWATALAAIGVTVLGEVVTFATARQEEAA